ncbi:MAG: hypothetical protein NC040_10505 [Muribaculaceae bacterium]|nr:hypothetical protein [Alistipes senegalensis]MCM1474482.1 hypothetical protein [Muribaculaceae bacterium]
MLINANITLFEKENYTPHFIENVYFSDSREQTVAKNGVQISDSVLIYIYSDGYFPKSGDILVKNRCDFSFDNSSQKSSSESMKQFREEYPDFAVVKNVNNYWFGGLPHIEVTAK